MLSGIWGRLRAGGQGVKTGWRWGLALGVGKTGVRMRDGVIYVASGAAYVDLAVASARSLRAVDAAVAVDLYTDLPEAVPEGLFDRVHPLVDPDPREKLKIFPTTRFERTLFLDSDTIVLAPVSGLFDLLERFDLAAAHDVRRTWDLIRQGDRHETPEAFPQLNSGVFLYRKSPAMRAFLDEWARRFFADETITRDQVILKDLLWESDVRFYVLPPEYNLRRVTELDAWEPLDARPTVVHSHRFMDHFDGVSPRVESLADLLPLERDALAAEWAEDAEPWRAAWRQLRTRD